MQPFIEIPSDIEEKPKRERTRSEKKLMAAIEATNDALLNSVRSIAKFDPRASRIRFGTLFVLASGVIAGAIAFLVGVFDSKDAATIITGGAVTVGALVVGGLMNPLQTVERDIIYRRWSDTIMYVAWLRLADRNAGPSQFKSAANDASAQFAALAGAYAANSAKALETLEIIVNGSEDADDKSEKAEGLSITHPGDQTDTMGEDIEELTIQATGENLRYTETGLPSGLKLKAETGVVSGSPDKVTPTPATVNVSVTQAETDSKASVTFKWTVEKKSDEPNEGDHSDEDK